MKSDLKALVNHLEKYKQGVLSLEELVYKLHEIITPLYEELPPDIYNSWSKNFGVLDVALADAYYESSVLYDRRNEINLSIERMIQLFSDYITELNAE